MSRLCLIILTCVACVEPPIDLGGEIESERVQVVDVPPDINEELDLLFVVDNTEGMAPKQLALTTSFERLVSHLRFAEGGVPSLHVGVISTDLGVGFNDSGFNEVPGCTTFGDSGRLQSEPRTAGCPAPDGSYMQQVVYEDMTTEKNFSGDIIDAFACISQLGTSGCRFEQPLEAMRLAIEHDDTGFLRDGAVLAVVFLTDDDDCSVYDSNMFDPDLDPAGLVSDFRCFENGVVCKGDDVFEAGKREGCEPRTGSPYMWHVDNYVDFLKDTKADPRNIVVTGMMGTPDLVEITMTLDDQPQLVPSCMGDTGEAYPAIRLQHLVDGFGETAYTSSICGSEPFSALSSTAKRIRKTLGTRCLDNYLTDSDPFEPGRQPDCIVSDVHPDGSRTVLPACDNTYMPERSSTFPCYVFRTGPAPCGDFPTQLALNVCRGPDISTSCLADPQPRGTHTIAECLVYEPDRE